MNGVLFCNYSKFSSYSSQRTIKCTFMLNNDVSPPLWNSHNCPFGFEITLKNMVKCTFSKIKFVNELIKVPSFSTRSYYWHYGNIIIVPLVVKLSWKNTDKSTHTKTKQNWTKQNKGRCDGYTYVLGCIGTCVAIVKRTHKSSADFVVLWMYQNLLQSCHNYEYISVTYNTPYLNSSWSLEDPIFRLIFHGRSKLG